MTNATINGNGLPNSATVVNPDRPAGGVNRDPTLVSVTLNNATINAGNQQQDRFYDVSFAGGDDTLIGENMALVNTTVAEIGFGEIDMGGGNDLVSLSVSGFYDGVFMGTGDDTLILDNSAGYTVDMGGGNDLTQLSLQDARDAPTLEASQKIGQDPMGMDGGAGIDTLDLKGEWSLTLAQGRFGLDLDGDGVADVQRATLAASDYSKVVSMPNVLSGTVQWGGVATIGGETVVSQATFSNYEVLNAVCFTEGTLIDTPDGQVPVESLREGDMVLTRSGPCPIRWVGKRRLDLIDLMANPKLLPIRVPAGAFGGGKPERDVCFSPQHRVVVRSAVADLMFDASEVLVPVKNLVGVNGITVDGDARSVTYLHIMLDEHEVVRADGLEAETMYPGPQALEVLTKDVLDELRAIFPDFDRLAAEDRRPSAALPFLKGREGRALAARLGRSSEVILS